MSNDKFSIGEGFAIGAIGIVMVILAFLAYVAIGFGVTYLFVLFALWLLGLAGIVVPYTTIQITVVLFLVTWIGKSIFGGGTRTVRVKE
jgi:hypothetical protein